MKPGDLEEKGYNFFVINWDLSGRLICVLFSPCREKSTKRAPRKGGPQGASLTEPTTYARDPFAHRGAKESECAEGRGYPIARTNGGAPSARKSSETRRRKKKISRTSPRTGLSRELGAPPRLRTSVNM